MLELFMAKLKKKLVRTPVHPRPLSYLAVSRGHAPREQCSSRAPPISLSHIHALLDSFPPLHPLSLCLPRRLLTRGALFCDVLCSKDDSRFVVPVPAAAAAAAVRV